jgi:hypothetical protein
MLTHGLRLVTGCGVVVGLLCSSGAWAAHHRASPPAGTKRPARAVALPPPADPWVALSDAQLALAPAVATGVLPCELAQRVSVQAHADYAGHFVLQLGPQRFTMVPVVATTGAIRLEDAARGAVWLQLANKSMLMDQRQGRRLVDSCISAEQQSVALALEKNPAPHLLEPLPIAEPRDESAMK